MQINQVIENEDGSANITGTLSGQELEVAVALGLNMLYAQGLMSQLTPSLDLEENSIVVEAHQFHDEPDTQQ